MAYDPPTGKVYKALSRPDKEIRLLKFTSSDSATPSFKLRAYDLETAPDFVALSYEWGEFDSSRIAQVTVNGYDVGIRQNLFCLLKELNRKQRHRPDFRTCYWIDAICIDQTDQKEREAQVRLMSAVYGRAVLVLAWLGEVPNNNRDLKWFVDHRRELEAEIQGWIKTHNLVDSDISKEAQQLLLMLGTRTYWTRRWILQELFLARRIYLMWGEFEIPWGAYVVNFWKIENGHTEVAYLKELYENKLSNSLVYLIVYYCGVDEASILAGKSTTRRFSGVQKRPLLDLLIEFGPSKCQLDHDRVYALLGLAREGDDIPVDYSIPMKTVYAQVIRRCGLSQKAIKMVQKESRWVNIQLSPDLQRYAEHQDTLRQRPRTFATEQKDRGRRHDRDKRGRGQDSE